MTTPRVRLGELLVAAQIITREQLDEALAQQKNDGRRLGKLLVDGGFVTETQVTQILSQQLSVPWVSLYHIDFSRQLLELVSQDLAEKYGLVPIFVRRVRGLGETLYVAMDDPSDEAAQQEVSKWCGLPVRAMIAPPSDVRSAIRVYYGSGKDSASLSEAVAELEAEEASRNPPTAQAAAAASSSTDDGEIEISISPTPAPAALKNGVNAASLKPTSGDPIPPPPDSSPRIEARELSMPAPAAGKSRRFVTLTLLDGTQVNLPARGKTTATTKNERGEAGDLTARDLVAALRAVSHGADASEILGDATKWEPLFAALLSLLLKKHLIADWEFVEEYKKF